MTTVVISQPMYLPWPGFLAQLSMADVVVWLDDAQFSKGSFTNRVQVNLPSGKSWLSIPLENKGSGILIGDLIAAKQGWLDSHIATLKQSLKGTLYLSEALQVAESLRSHANLSDALIASSTNLAAACGIAPDHSLLSSKMNITGAGSARVLETVKTLGGTRYVTGHGARNYLNHEAFEAAGVNVDYMEYEVLPWGPQVADFSPYVTSLDLLAHVGGAGAADHLIPKTVNWRAFLHKPSLS